MAARGKFNPQNGWYLYPIFLRTLPRFSNLFQQIFSLDDIFNNLTVICSNNYAMNKLIKQVLPSTPLAIDINQVHAFLLFPDPALWGHRCQYIGLQRSHTPAQSQRRGNCWGIHDNTFWICSASLYFVLLSWIANFIRKPKRVVESCLS